jgi:hypothetical protein
MTIERGSAGINLRLSNGVITVRHSECNTVLAEWLAEEGDWDRIWIAIRDIKQEREVISEVSGE